MSRQLTGLIAGFGVLAACMAGDGAKRPISAHGVEFRAAGEVGEVTGSGIPNSITIQTQDGPLTVAVAAETRFELDDPDAVMMLPEAMKTPGGVRPLHDRDGDGQDDHEVEQEAGFREDLTRLSGHFVTCIYERGSMTAEEIQIETRFEVFGRVSAVRRNALVIQPFGGSPLALGVDTETEVTMDGMDVPALSSLLGRFVEAHFDPASLVARKLEGTSQHHIIRGTLSAIDVLARTLRVRDGRRNVTIAVAPEADINLDFQDSVLEEILPGSQMWVAAHEMDGALMVGRIDALTTDTLRVTGRVGETAAASHTLQIEPAMRRSRPAGTRPGTVLKVNGGTQISLNGRPARLGWIPSDAKVTATYARRDGWLVARTLRAQAPRQRP